MLCDQVPDRAGDESDSKWEGEERKRLQGMAGGERSGVRGCRVRWAPVGGRDHGVGGARRHRHSKVAAGTSSGEWAGTEEGPGPTVMG